MASIRNRNGKWQARITRKGQQPIAKSFLSKQDAERWARQVETEIDKGSYTNLVLAERNEKSVMFRYLTDIGNRCNIFYKQLKTRGQPPSGYAKLDLSDRDQLALAILKTLPSKKPSITMWNAMCVQVRIMNVGYGL